MGVPLPSLAALRAAVLTSGLLAAGLGACAAGASAPTTGGVALPDAVPNDNRAAAGEVRGGVRRVELVARRAAWRPDSAVDSTVTVQAFAEGGEAPRIPGPLLRAGQGTVLRVTLRNALPDSTLVVHGLRAGRAGDDTVQVAPGATREVTVRTDVPGTYLYWGTTTGARMGARWDRDAQLTGALVVDPAGVAPDTAERIFVLTAIDLYRDTTDVRRRTTREDIWEVAINGRSWPYTERLDRMVGDTVRWRWLNGSYLPHPMHLHGFHYRVLARGDGSTDTTFAADRVPEEVTELMMPGGTMRMAWVPTRPGNWLMHCHMLPHVVPFPERPDSLRRHEDHDAARHAMQGMAGLVMGVTVRSRGKVAEAPVAASERLRLFVQQGPAPRDSGARGARGYVLQRGGAEPARDSVEVPGAPLILRRGRTTRITVLNRLSHPTTVHWHGMELLSVYDGVSGWSGLDAQRAPLVAPGDSFTVAITPPRAGTFIYHTHMDEEQELRAGLYGPLLVLEPDERWDPERDIPIFIADAIVEGRPTLVLNGRRPAPPRTVRAGVPHRLRIINIGAADPVRMVLTASGTPVPWVQVAKDGAALPAALRRPRTDSMWVGVGETFDFEWTPTAATADARLEVLPPFGAPPITLPFRVR
jgi:FtsP/CotA-like multicopper oxidase with cupredoxin domain